MTLHPSTSPSPADRPAPECAVEIAAVEPRLVSVPLSRPLHMSGEVVAAAENLIVRVTDRDGTVGWGEAASAPMMTGETGAGLLEAARFMGPRLIGRELTAATVRSATEPLMFGNHGAKAALRTALLDLLARKAKVPLYELLGGRRRQRAAALVLLGAKGADEVAQAKRLADAGVRALKVKVGLDAVPADLARARAVRDAVGPDIRISADANTAFGRDDAIAFMRGAASAGLDFVEQPVADDDLDSLRACAAASPVPLCIDESLHGPDDIRRVHELGAAHGGNLKLIKLGGPAEVIAAAALLDALGMHVNIAGKVAETSIAGAAAIHIAVAAPRLDWDLSVTNRYLADDVVHTPVAMRDGHFAPPAGPGLGVEPDEEKLARYTLAR